MAKQDTRCYADRRQYLIAAVYKRRRKIRQMAIEYKGGKCSVCGYNNCIEALEFHHANSSPIVTAKFMPKSQLLRETVVETAGELLEALLE